MLEKKCVLLLYSEGRQDTSMLAVVEELEKHKDTYVIAMSDRELYSFNRSKMGAYMYKLSSRYMNFVNRLHVFNTTISYKMYSKRTKKPIKAIKRPTTPFAEFMFSLTSKYRRIFNVLNRFSPDIVLCSTPKLLKDVIKAKYKGKLSNMSVAGLLTDYTLDRRFVNFKANYYFVQNINILERLVALGIDKRKIKVVGTPIQESVKVKYDRESVLSEFGISNGYVNVVLMAGRYGGSSLKNIFTNLLQIDLDMNILVMTGGNHGLSKYCTLLAKSKRMHDRVILVESVDDIAKIYAIADILISKPTASITYEAIYHKVKLITYKGADRIEAQNNHYLVTNQVALVGGKSTELLNAMSKYLCDEEYIESLPHIDENFANGDCAKELVKVLLYIAEKNFSKKLQTLNSENVETIANETLKLEESKEE